MIEYEEACIVRGIYHSTMFAKYWSLQEGDAKNHHRIQAAINARFIMNNDLSRITDQTSEGHLPYLIHYPAWASSYTYEQLAHRKPSMKPQIARAAIVKDDQGLYDSLNVTPDYFIVCEARASPNPYYLADLLSRAKNSGIDVLNNPSGRGWRAITRRDAMELTTTHLHNAISPESVVDDGQVQHIYDGTRADISQIELFVRTPDYMKPKDSDFIDLTDIYHEASNPGQEWSTLSKD